MMLRRLSLCAFAIAFAACTPKQSLTVEIQINRSDLTELEVVIDDSGGKELTRCRIYADLNSAPEDACPFEDADANQFWSGESRPEADPLRFLIYGDLDSVAVSIVVAGYKQGSRVTTASVTAAEFLAESPKSVKIILKAAIEIETFCETDFTTISGTMQGQSNIAMSLLKTESGYDIIYAGTPDLVRFRYNRQSSSESSCIEEVGKKRIGNCAVSPEHLLVGEFFGSDIEKVALICPPTMPGGMGGINPTPLRLRIFDPSSAEDEERKDFPSSIKHLQISPLVLVPQVSENKIEYEPTVLYAETASAAAPTLSILRGLKTSTAVTRTHTFQDLSPVVRCQKGQPCNGSNPERCNGNEFVPVLENGCVSCRPANEFDEIPACLEREFLYKQQGSNERLSCLPKSNCLFDAHLSAQLGPISAPFPPLSFAPKDINGQTREGLVIAGYAGGIAYRLTGRGGFQERAIQPSRASLFQPVSITKDGESPVIVADFGTTLKKDLILKIVRLLPDVEQKDILLDLNESSPSQASRRAYAVGTNTSSSSKYVVFGDFYLSRVEGEQFQTNLELHRVFLDAEAVGPGQNMATQAMQFVFPADSPSNGVRGMASVRLGDLDGDPSDTEILVYQPEYGAQIHGFKIVSGEMVSLPGFPIKLENREALSDPRSLSVILADLDSDGRIEIIASDTTKLRIFSLGIGSYNPDNLSWPMERRDRRNSGNYTSARDPNAR